MSDSTEDPHSRASESKLALRKLAVVSVMCLTFMTIEFFGGYISGSMAIMTDAAHLLSDFSGFVISMISVWLGTKEANRRLSFGFHRAEVIGALTSVFLIWGLTLILVLEAIERIINPVEVDGKIMLITATFGLFFNLIMVKVLHGTDGHAHHNCAHNHQNDENITYEMQELGIDAVVFESGAKGGDDESLSLKAHDSLDHKPEALDGTDSKSFDYGSDFKLETKAGENLNKSSFHHVQQLRHTPPKVNHKHFHTHHDHHNLDSVAKNLNVRAAVIHIMGDIIQAIGVLLAAVIIYMFPSWQIVDPICTFMFSILVMFTTYFIVKDCLIILLEGVPTEISYRDVKLALERIKGVISVKELHIWSLTSGKN